MIVYCRIHCLLGMTIMYVHSNVLTSITLCSELKFVLHRSCFRGSTLAQAVRKCQENFIAVTRPEVMEYLYVKQIVQQFTKNAYRKNIVVRAKCLLIYYTNVFKLF